MNQDKPKPVMAEEFNKKPKSVYRRADKGEKVEIIHSHYEDRVFVLTAEDRK